MYLKEPICHLAGENDGNHYNPVRTARLKARILNGSICSVFKHIINVIK
jgi:hypothetical protein